MRKAWKEKWIVLRPIIGHHFGYPGFFTATHAINNQGFRKVLNLEILYFKNTLVLSYFHTNYNSFIVSNIY